MQNQTKVEAIHPTGKLADLIGSECILAMNMEAGLAVTADIGPGGIYILREYNKVHPFMLSQNEWTLGNSFELSPSQLKLLILMHNQKEAEKSMKAMQPEGAV